MSHRCGFDAGAQRAARGAVRAAARCSGVSCSSRQPPNSARSPQEPWGDRGTRQVHTAQPVYLEWCRRVVADLVERRHMPLATLVRGKYVLRKAVLARVEQLRLRSARAGVQQFLDGLGEPVLSDACVFAFDLYRYNVASFWSGGFVPQRHFYARVGKMNPFEAEVARVLDGWPGLEVGVRNGELLPGNYALPTSRGNFFPDFVARLDDGRLLLVEAKGRSDEYDCEKDNIGRRAAEVSDGRLAFVTVWQNDDAGRSVQQQIAAAL